MSAIAVFIGAPGSGKTKTGKRVAKALGVRHIDTDKVVVAAHGPIPQIFAEHGERHFRALEREAVASALEGGGVVSLGGGAVLDEDTRRDLATATVVLLTIEADAVRSRIGNGKRPLVTDLDSWKRLVTERMPLYESLATRTVDTTSRPVDGIVEELARWIEEEGL